MRAELVPEGQGARGLALPLGAHSPMGVLSHTPEMSVEKGGVPLVGGSTGMSPEIGRRITVGDGVGREGPAQAGALGRDLNLIESKRGTERQDISGAPFIM